MSDNVIRPTFGRDPLPGVTDQELRNSVNTVNLKPMPLAEIMQRQEMAVLDQTPELVHLIREAANTTRARGFDLSQHATVIAMIATEVSEALDLITYSHNPEINNYVEDLGRLSAELEAYRRKTAPGEHTDHSQVKNTGKLYRELADIVLRVFSYAGANGHEMDLYHAIHGKLRENSSRPWMHDKGF